jgi:hypothetical protein
MQDVSACWMLSSILTLRQKPVASNWTYHRAQNLTAFQCKVKFSVIISRYTLKVIETLEQGEGEWSYHCGACWMWVRCAPVESVAKRQVTTPYGGQCSHLLNFIVWAIMPVPTSHINSVFSKSFCDLSGLYSTASFSIHSSRLLCPDCSVSSVVINFILYYATSRKVTILIADEVIGFFSWLNPSSRTMARGSTQPLAEISTRNLPGGKGRPTGA